MQQVKELRKGYRETIEITEYENNLRPKTGGFLFIVNAALLPFLLILHSRLLTSNTLTVIVLFLSDVST